MYPGQELVISINQQVYISNIVSFHFLPGISVVSQAPLPQIKTRMLNLAFQSKFFCDILQLVTQKTKLLASDKVKINMLIRSGWGEAVEEKLSLKMLAVK